MSDNASPAWVTETAEAFGNILRSMGGGLQGLVVEPVDFIQAATPIRSVRTEYRIEGNKVKFHFWGDPKFPDGFPDAVRAALSAFDQDDVLVEYVPEVSSWYTHVDNLRLGVTPGLVERLVGKISAEVG